MRFEKMQSGHNRRLLVLGEKKEGVEGALKKKKELFQLKGPGNFEATCDPFGGILVKDNASNGTSSRKGAGWSVEMFSLFLVGLCGAVSST